MLRVTRRAPVGSSSRLRTFARLNLLPSASCRAGMWEVASDTQGAAAWRFFLNPEQSFRSQRHGVGSGLVALLHVDLEKCACVLFHSSIVHGWDGNPTLCPPSTALRIPHTGRLWETSDLPLFSLQTRTFPENSLPSSSNHVPSRDTVSQ